MYINSYLWRSLIVVHRYIGIAIGWLMLMWCLSGFVMMYVGWPSPTAAERAAGLRAVTFTSCCSLPADLVDAGEPIAGFNVQMLGGRPVLRLEREFGPAQLIDLQQGTVVDTVTQDDALSVANEYLRHQLTVDAKPRVLGLIDHDQWTVSGNTERRPFFHLALDDADGTELYVSSIDGTLVQKTSRTQRFWNWLGAIPHWLYPTWLREHVEWWTRLVVWSSLIGGFLAVFGLVLGIVQLRRRRDRSWHSPYVGWKYWHHVPGLLFGLLVLTWVTSGFLSMNPWGWLESQAQPAGIAGAAPTWASMQPLIKLMSQAKLPTNIVSIDGKSMQGEWYVVATARDGTRTRFNAEWQLAPLREEDMRRAVSSFSADPSAPPKLEMLDQEDAYYYSQGGERVTLPVWRMINNDPQATRYYFDTLTGELLLQVDRNARWYRWLHSGLHRMDFLAMLRTRPLWDLLMLFLLAGATVVCGTGTWLAIKRLSRK